MTIGFIGFGEAASSIAIGLRAEGAGRLLCYDALQDDANGKVDFDKRLAACGAEKAASAAEVCRKAGIVISAVPSQYALAAVQSALPGVEKGLLYMDVSTATPAEKRGMAGLIESKGASFIDGAMLGTLLKDKHKVPMLLSGSGAPALKAALEPFHMRLEVIEGAPGVATSVKFIRSITAKGLSCLLIESLQAAQRFGVEDAIVNSLLDSFGPAFIDIIDGYVSGAILHAERREHEMENVVDFLKSESLPFTMAEATREKLAWAMANKLKDRFEGGVPRSWAGVLKGWKQ